MKQILLPLLGIVFLGTGCARTALDRKSHATPDMMREIAASGKPAILIVEQDTYPASHGYRTMWPETHHSSIESGPEARVGAEVLVPIAGEAIKEGFKIIPELSKNHYDTVKSVMNHKTETLITGYDTLTTEVFKAIVEHGTAVPSDAARSAFPPSEVYNGPPPGTNRYERIHSRFQEQSRKNKEATDALLGQLQQLNASLDGMVEQARDLKDYRAQTRELIRINNLQLDFLRNLRDTPLFPGADPEPGGLLPPAPPPLPDGAEPDEEGDVVGETGLIIPRSPVILGGSEEPVSAPAVPDAKEELRVQFERMLATQKEIAEHLKMQCEAEKK